MDFIIDLPFFVIIFLPEIAALCVVYIWLQSIRNKKSFTDWYKNDFFLSTSYYFPIVLVAILSIGSPWVFLYFTLFTIYISLLNKRIKKGDFSYQVDAYFHFTLSISAVVLSIIVFNIWFLKVHTIATGVYAIHYLNLGYLWHKRTIGKEETWML